LPVVSTLSPLINIILNITYIMDNSIDVNKTSLDKLKVSQSKILIIQIITLLNGIKNKTIC